MGSGRSDGHESTLCLTLSVIFFSMCEVVSFSMRIVKDLCTRVRGNGKRWMKEEKSIFFGHTSE